MDVKSNIEFNTKTKLYLCCNQTSSCPLQRKREGTASEARESKLVRAVFPKLFGPQTFIAIFFSWTPILCHINFFAQPTRKYRNTKSVEKISCFKQAYHISLGQTGTVLNNKKIRSKKKVFTSNLPRI